jgi:hypothetical protein
LAIYRHSGNFSKSLATFFQDKIAKEFGDYFGNFLLYEIFYISPYKACKI